MVALKCIQIFKVKFLHLKRPRIYCSLTPAMDSQNDTICRYLLVINYYFSYQISNNSHSSDSPIYPIIPISLIILIIPFLFYYSDNSQKTQNYLRNRRMGQNNYQRIGQIETFSEKSDLSEFA